MRSFASAMALVSCAYLVVAIAWPHVAERMLQMLLATLAFGWVGARVYRSALPMRMSHDAYSPFDRAREAPDPQTGPAALQALTKRLGSADDIRQAKRTAIPGEAAEIVCAEASRRLAECHGVVLGDPLDHARARDLVGESTWALIHPLLHDVSAPSDRRASRGPVPLSDLTRILDDLESL